MNQDQDHGARDTSCRPAAAAATSFGGLARGSFLATVNWEGVYRSYERPSRRHQFAVDRHGPGAVLHRFPAPAIRGPGRVHIAPMARICCEAELRRVLRLLLPALLERVN